MIGIVSLSREALDGTGLARRCYSWEGGYAGQRQCYPNEGCLSSWACDNVDESRDMAQGACLRDYYRSMLLGWGYADEGRAKILGECLTMIDGEELWPWGHIEEVEKDALGVEI